MAAFVMLQMGSGVQESGSCDHGCIRFPVSWCVARVSAYVMSAAGPACDCCTGASYVQGLPEPSMLVFIMNLARLCLMRR
jgi:hypothetical protein